MDITLGDGIDGIEAASKILKLIKVPIVFLTAHTEKKVLEDVNKIFGYGIVYKNSGDFILYSTVDMALSLFESQSKMEKSELDLKVSNERLSLAMEGSGAAVWDWDLHTNQFYCSPKLRQIFELPANKEIKYYNDFLKLVHPEDIDIVLPKPSIYDDETNSTFKSIFRIKVNKEFKQVMCRGKIILNKDGIPVRYTGIMYIEQDLIPDSEKLHALNSVIENSDCIIVFKDKELRVAATNNAFAKAAGYNSYRELIGKTDAEIFGVSPDTEPVATYMKDERRAQLLKKGESITREEEVKYKDGSTHIVYTKKFPVFDQSEKLIGTANMSIDITELKEKEKELKESEQRFELILKTLPLSVFVHDLEGNLKIINKMASNSTGYTRQELLNMNVSDIDHNSLKRDDRKNIWKKLLNGSSQKIESKHYRKDGSSYPVQINITAISYYGEKLFLAIAHDITDQKRTEHEQENLLNQKDLLIKEVHCRVKNNMNTIMSLLHLQADSLDNSFTSKTLREAAGRIQSMQFLYNKLEKNGDFSTVSTKQYLESLAENITSNNEYPKQINIIENIEDIFLHPNYLFHMGIILNEIITNSLKHAFSEVMNPEIIISFTKDGEDFIFSIEDNGCGFPEDLIVYDNYNFGLSLIKMFSETFNGDFKITNDNGFKYTLEFKL